MDYKELTLILLDKLKDDKLWECLFYIVQKMIGRGI